MKNCSLFLLLLCFACSLAFAGESHREDSLKRLLSAAPHDSVKCRLLLQLIEIKPKIAEWQACTAELKKLCEAHMNKTSANENKLFLSYFAASLVNTAEHLEEQNKALEAAEQYKTAKDAYEKAGSLRGQASTLLALCNAYRSVGEVKKMEGYVKKSLELNRSIDNKKGIARSMENYAIYERNAGDSKAADEWFKKAIDAYNKCSDKEGVALTLNGEALLYKETGDIAKALELAQRALRIGTETGSSKIKTHVLDNLGSIYAEQGDNAKALEYFFESYDAALKDENEEGVSNAMNNIGTIYYKQKNVPKALEYYEKVLALEEKMGDMNSACATLNNLGTVYYEKGDVQRSIGCFERCLAIQEEVGNKIEAQYVLDNLALIFYGRNEYTKALPFAQRSMAISREFGYPSNLAASADVLHLIYMEINKPKEAFEMYQLSVKMQDSISNEETRKASLQSQLKYEYEKKVARDSIRTLEEKKVEVFRIRQQRTQRNALYGGLTLVSLFAMIMVNRSRVASRQKKQLEEQKKIVDEQKRLLEHQKAIVEERQKEIMDSIHYARRIQHALITNEHNISAMLKRLIKE